MSLPFCTACTGLYQIILVACTCDLPHPALLASGGVLDRHCAMAARSPTCKGCSKYCIGQDWSRSCVFDAWLIWSYATGRSAERVLPRLHDSRQVAFRSLPQCCKSGAACVGHCSLVGWLRHLLSHCSGPKLTSACCAGTTAILPSGLTPCPAEGVDQLRSTSRQQESVLTVML